MRKVGFEIEGRDRGQGVFTMFCDPQTYLDLVEWNELFPLLRKHNCVHINIYDVHNDLDLIEVSRYFWESDIKVTVEVSELKAVAPNNVEIFWNVSRSSYEQSRTLHFLRPRDQIKIENELTVLSWERGNAYVTEPIEFEGDVEV